VCEAGREAEEGPVTLYRWRWLPLLLELAYVSVSGVLVFVMEGWQRYFFALNTIKHGFSILVEWKNKARLEEEATDGRP
jgi:hypothetical protein